jgi:hypothetical protein
MKWALVSLLLICAPFANGQAASPSSHHASDEPAIRHLNEEWLKAYDAGDVKILDRIEGGDHHAHTISARFGTSDSARQPAPYQNPNSFHHPNPTESQIARLTSETRNPTRHQSRSETYPRLYRIGPVVVP